MRICGGMCECIKHLYNITHRPSYFLANYFPYFLFLYFFHDILMLDIYCFLLNMIMSQYIIMNLYHIKFVYYLCTYNNNGMLHYNYTYYGIEQLH